MGTAHEGMIQLPWPTNSEHESTPPPRTELDASHTHESDQSSELLASPHDQQRRVGRHRAPEIESPPSDPIEHSLEVIKAMHLRINLAWAGGEIATLRDIASDDAEEPRFREDAERRIALLLRKERERAIGWTAIEQAKRHPALDGVRMFLPTIQKTAE